MMARRRVCIPLDSPAPAPPTHVVALSLEEFAPPKRPKRKTRPSTGKTDRERFYTEAEEWRAAGRWDAFKPGHFVALYGLCHEKVYGIFPTELTQASTFALARMTAKRVLEKEFDGKVQLMRAFIAWTWKREEGREKWRRENGGHGGRIGWKWQFNQSLVTEYRIDLARRLNGK